MDVNQVKLATIRRYCSYQERCHSEVRYKLISLKVYGDELESMISQLIQEDFLNEERYARAYCSGKHRIKKWGRHKIVNGLKKNKISTYCIKKGLEEIEEEEYLDNLYQLLSQKIRHYKIENKSEVKRKLVAFGLGKGYSYDEINAILPKVTETI